MSVQDFAIAFFMCFAFSMAGVFGAMAAGVPPVTVWIGAVGGMYANVAVTMLIGYPVRHRIVAFVDQRESKREARGKKRSKFQVLSERYGAKAIGLLAPTSVGTWPGTLVGIAIGLRRRHLAIWLGLGIPLWVTFYVIVLAQVPRG